MNEMVKEEAPKYAYVVAIISSVVAVPLLFVVLFLFKPSPPLPVGLAAGLCWILGVVFAFIWPSGSWRWGLWVSSGFWCFFGFTFGSFLLNGQFVWEPAIEAISVAAVACTGAFCGMWFSKRLRKKYDY